MSEIGLGLAKKPHWKCRRIIISLKKENEKDSAKRDNVGLKIA